MGQQPGEWGAPPSKRSGLPVWAILLIIAGPLLVIIGIIAAVSVPVFLNQRDKGYDAAAKNDLRNAATAQEVFLTDQSVYAASADQLGAAGFIPSELVSLEVVSVRGSYDSYCLRASHAENSDSVWYLDSAVGATPSQEPCS